MGEDAPVVADTTGPVTTVTLNRPERLNAISPAVVDAIDAALDGLTASTRVLVITGRGRAFSAGGDLEAVEAMARERGLGAGAGTEEFHAAISAVLRRLELLDFPVVAAVNGLAVAGGLEIACACDVVLAVESARFGDGHANYGLLPAGGGSVRLPRRLGVGRAKYLMYTGETVSAATMRDWGLVAELVGDGELAAATDRLTARLAAASRDGLGRMKTMVDRGLEMTVDDALAHEQKVAAEHVHAADYAEGLSAFRERRAPRFD
ncbi:enoyl-CoA hydratase-related protein [Actinomycetospora sp. OC33-EN08]|uniref:Enoyl-CoA hydratase-related protein n=1 Tax=Actinomycetospora aurantiaca TaxID=3129233 RepID=A0ABU8MT88_9PSEU